jgi:hypothetical protein
MGTSWDKQQWEKQQVLAQQRTGFKVNENMTLDEIFHENLPQSLTMSHYDLAAFTNRPAQEWRRYLKEQQIFIETELAAITEAEARSALSRLGQANGAEVQALKALLEKSALIINAQKQREKVLLTFLPPQEEN